MKINSCIFGSKQNIRNDFWGNIFCVSKYEEQDEKFGVLLEKRKKEYSELITDYDLSTGDVLSGIRVCVDVAMKEGNHVLFAEYLLNAIEKNKYSSDSPANSFFSCINRILEAKDCSVSDLIVFKETKGNYWRDKDYTINSAGSECFYNSTNIRKKMNGDSISKDSAVQIGLQLGLDAETINKWMMIIGRSRLYVLDIVDSIGMYYLDYYSRLDREKKLEFPDYSVSLKEGRLRLAYVKEKINTYINQIDTNLETKLDIVPKQIKGKGHVYHSDVIKYNKDDNSWNIHHYINNLDRKYKINRDFQYDDALTTHFKNGFNEYGEKEFLTFLDNNLSIFLQVKYAFYANVAAFIEDVDSLKKNLLFYSDNSVEGELLDYYSGKELSSQNSKEIEKIIDIQNEGDYPSLSIKSINEFNKNGRLRSVDGYYNLVSLIYGISNCLEKNYFDVYPSKNDLYNKMRGDGKKGERDLREFSKNDIVKLAVATGHENDLGQLMMSGCYWEVDLLNEVIAKDYLDRGGFLDAMDMYILYSYYYRDRLINKWIYDNCGKNTDSLRLDYMKRFPMVSLMAIISRDIQFVIGYMKNKYFFNEFYNSFCHSSAYRTVDSSMKWFDEDLFPPEKKERVR